MEEVNIIEFARLVINDYARFCIILIVAVYRGDINLDRKIHVVFKFNTFNGTNDTTYVPNSLTNKFLVLCYCNFKNCFYAFTINL